MSVEPALEPKRSADRKALQPTPGSGARPPEAKVSGPSAAPARPPLTTPVAITPKQLRIALAKQHAQLPEAAARVAEYSAQRRDAGTAKLWEEVEQPDFDFDFEQ